MAQNQNEQRPNQQKTQAAGDRNHPQDQTSRRDADQNFEQRSDRSQKQTWSKDEKSSSQEQKGKM